MTARRSGVLLGLLLVLACARDGVAQLGPPGLVELMPTTTITTAVTGGIVTGPRIDGIVGMYVFAKFTYGSDGTSAKFWVQTSFDGGASWADVVNFAFTTASAKKVAQVIRVGANPVAVTDGTAADDTVAGPPGQLWRVKYTTVGTYASSTTIRITTYFYR